MARTFIRLGVLLAAIGLADCIVPIPQNHDIGREVMVDPSEVGVVTEQDVLAKWGAPTAIWENPRIFVYRWDHVSWGVLWFVGGEGGVFAGGFGDVPKRHMLLIQFDNSGHIKRAEHVEPSDNESYEHFDRYIEAWAEGMTDAKQ